MLALIFTETGLHLETCELSLEDWLISRILLAQRLAETIQLETSWASLLLPDDLPEIGQVAGVDEVELCHSEAEWVEVSLEGIWLSSDPEQISGVLVTEIDAETEQLIYQLWRASRSCLMA